LLFIINGRSTRAHNKNATNIRATKRGERPNCEHEAMRRIVFSGKSDVGLRRRENEDTYRIEPQLGFCLVADGVGGAVAGELASRLFSEAAWEVFRQGTDFGDRNVFERVQESFRLANLSILEHIQYNSSYKGMACTAELMALSNEGFVLGHLGDSRTYRYRNHRLRQLTKDHSLVQEQIDQRLISPEGARSHPWRNVIVRAVGMDEELALDIVRGPTYPGDQFLLCSDGLTDMVDDIDISSALGRATSLDQKADDLIEMALKAGGLDNVTVVLVSIL
jgi:protein phosphatase